MECSTCCELSTIPLWYITLELSGSIKLLVIRTFNLGSSDCKQSLKSGEGGFLDLFHQTLTAKLAVLGLDEL